MSLTHGGLARARQGAGAEREIIGTLARRLHPVTSRGRKLGQCDQALPSRHGVVMLHGKDRRGPLRGTQEKGETGSSGVSGFGVQGDEETGRPFEEQF